MEITDPKIDFSILDKLTYTDLNELQLKGNKLNSFFF